MEVGHSTIEPIDCPCEICKYQIPFSIPKELAADFVSGRIALFVGAGVSTESKSVLRHTLYDSIYSKLNLENKNVSFPDLMEKFANEPNGRINLLTEIQVRLDHIYSFPELYDNATRFHRELSTLFPIDTIVTTNWDTYFERECLATPFVYPADVAFWEAANRRVLKIHGTIENYGSIVATRTDYIRCQKDLDKNLIGALLKQILATKTLVFIGYSARDDDFIYIMKSVQKQMNNLSRKSYIVTLDNSADATKRYSELKLQPIFTDGTHFISQLKSHFESTECFLPDSVFEEVEELLDEVRTAHNELYDKLNIFDNPEIIMCACYQDGLIHALERVLRLKKSGTQSHRCDVINRIKKYTEVRADHLRRKRYDDVAYIDGYINGLIFLPLQTSDDDYLRSPPPLFYAFGAPTEIFNFKEYKKQLPSIPGFHKAAYKKCLRISEPFRRHSQKDVVIHHVCQL